MKKWITCLSVLLASFASYAQIPPILMEACNQMEPANKRMECLRAANRSSSGSSGSAAQLTHTSPTTARSFAGKKNTTCHTGPRGGTYTITASGRKNYGGC